MIKEAIIKLSKRQDLTYKEAEQVMNEIMENTASDVQKAAYLTALSMKGETIDEITASAAAMRAHGEKLLHNMDVLEIVGTGGRRLQLLQYLHHFCSRHCFRGVPGCQAWQPGSLLQIRSR